MGPPPAFTTTNVTIPKTMCALRMLGKSLGMLIAKGNPCNRCLGVNSLADAIIYKELVGDRFGKDLNARDVLGDDWSWLIHITPLFSRTPPCK